MIWRGRAFAIGACGLLWLLAQPAQASELGDLARKGDVAAVAAALDKGAPVDELDGVTALYIACEGGNVALAKLLVDRGADVNMSVSWQRTPLYAASKAGYPDIVKLLLDHGADPHKETKAQTPLHVAAESGCLPCVIHLVEAGSDVNALSNGSPPIHLAKLAGHDDIVAYLREHGADRPHIAPISPRLASAHVDLGKQILEETCAGCHFVARGVDGPRRPNLWGIVGRRKAAEKNVEYSSGLREAGGEWTYEELNLFITSPARTLPGTDMIFPGLPEEEKRVDLIAYLRTLSDAPLPLPGN